VSIVVPAACLVLAAWAIESPVDPTPKPIWENVNHANRTTPEYSGFRWIASHTQPNDVIAVDARSTPSSCFQTAFAERRAIIDCYFGFAPEQAVASVGDLHGVIPTPLFSEVERRVQLNSAIFHGNAAAIASASRQFGLRYIVVDLASGGTPAETRLLGHAADLVFRNLAVAVFRVRG
jgi:hypothetical protein